MSEKDNRKKNEDYSPVTSVSPYENVKLQYRSQNALELTDSQLRLACLEASISFHENEVIEDPSTIVETAQHFWKFVNNSRE